MLTTPSRIIAATFASVALAAPPALPSYASAAPTRDVAAPAALVLPADPSAAATRDLATGTGQLTLAPDQRSPDARTPSRRIAAATVASDQRTPDARDAGAPSQPVVVAVEGTAGKTAVTRGGGETPADATVGRTRARNAPVVTGFDWTAAVIGAGGALALAMLAGAGIALMRRRSPHPVV